MCIRDRMRSHADVLKKDKFKIEYSKIEDKEFKESYFKKLKKLISTKKIKEISSFEVEDKFFEKKINQFVNKEKIKWNIIQTPMFLNSREDFKKYLSKSKKPFMATFYKDVRKKSGILMGSDGNPVGGKWSFDEDNRNKLPKDISIPKFPKIKETIYSPEDISIDIIYEDQDIIVLNKQAGIVTHPATGNFSGTLVNALLMHTSNSLSNINGNNNLVITTDSIEKSF